MSALSFAGFQNQNTATFTGTQYGGGSAEEVNNSRVVTKNLTVSGTATLKDVNAENVTASGNVYADQAVITTEVTSPVVTTDMVVGTPSGESVSAAALTPTSATYDGSVLYMNTLNRPQSSEFLFIDAKAEDVSMFRVTGEGTAVFGSGSEDPDPYSLATVIGEGFVYTPGSVSVGLDEFIGARAEIHGNTGNITTVGNITTSAGNITATLGTISAPTITATELINAQGLAMSPTSDAGSAIALTPISTTYGNSCLFINPATPAGTGFKFIDCRAADVDTFIVNGQGDVTGRSMSLSQGIAAAAFRGVQFDIATTVSSASNVTFTAAQLLSGHIRRTGFTASSTITDTMPSAADLILAIPENVRVADLAFNFHVYMVSSGSGSGTYGWTMGTGGSSKSGVNSYSLTAPVQFYTFRIRITSLGSGAPSYSGATYDFFRVSNVNAVA